ncbi:MAG: trypsin-like peptidase domain-containing protein [Candidatus Sulfopaludibacter sp.]|nr:trypsin-like peptidase domain-containing protein [Candidatus Sulfopaludibacter sp.]
MLSFGEVAERLRRSTVQVFSKGARGGGSGVIWKNDGLILTNAHVARHTGAQVQLWDGRRLDARVTSVDSRRDLAALRIHGDGLDLAAATPGDSSALRPGELVIAVGSPLGFAGAVSTGVVHSTGPLPGMGRQNWVRADVQLAPGNSGGPLADARGHVIGINTAIVNGLGVAVPGNAAVEFVRRGARPSLGVTLRPVQLGLEILKVESGGSAAAASLREGDILLGSFDDLSDALDSGRDVVRLRFFRGGIERVREVFVPLAARAEAA